MQALGRWEGRTEQGEGKANCFDGQQSNITVKLKIALRGMVCCPTLLWQALEFHCPIHPLFRNPTPPCPGMRLTVP